MVPPLCTVVSSVILTANQAMSTPVFAAPVCLAQLKGSAIGDLAIYFKQGFIACPCRLCK
jgi:hypothetical protein